MMKRILLLLFIAVLTLPALGQSTIVSTTGVVDTDGFTWSYGSYRISFVPNPNWPSPGTYQWTGGNLQNNLLFSGALSSTGTFSVSIPSNTAISPAGSQWKFSICPNANSGCFSVTTSVTGSTQDVTSIINASASGPRFPISGGIAYGYGTVEVNPSPASGSLFFDVTNGNTYQYTPAGWQLLVSAGQVIDPAAQYDVPFYSASGAARTLTGTNSITFNSATNILAFLQPQIYVTHPQFGTPSSCTNAADPTGVLDSTCALKAAFAYQTSLYTNSGGLYNAAVYFPVGLYKTSSELDASCDVTIHGDGRSGSIIEQTGAYADGLKVLSNTQPTNSEYICGGKLSDLTIEGQGLSTWGNLLELQNATGYVIDNVELTYTAGRGLQSLNSERMKINNLEINTVRMPAVFAGDANETHWTGVQINSPGTVDGTHCFSTDCGTSYTVPPPAPSGWSLSSATASGGVVTFVFTGATAAVYSVGHSIQVAGPWGLTGWQAVYPISTISYASGSTTITAPAYWGQSGSGSTSGATLETSWKPPSHAAITLGFAPQNVRIQNGSIKPLEFENGVQALGCDTCSVEKIYFEGYPVNATPPRISSSEVLYGPAYVMQISGTTSTGTTTTVPWNQGMWGITDVNDIGDVANLGIGDEVAIYPPDAAYGSTTMSSYQSGVEEGQYEKAYVAFTPVSTSAGYTVTLVSRDLSGSTAPANTAWVANSLMVLIPQSFYGGNFVSQGNHLDADTANTETGYYANCNDSVPGLMCAEIIASAEPNGISSQPPTNANNNSTFNNGGAIATFRDEPLNASGSEALGAGFIKNPSAAALTFDNVQGTPYLFGNSLLTQAGVPPSVGYNNQVAFDNVVVSPTYGVSGASWYWLNPNTGMQTVTLTANGDPFYMYSDVANQMQANSGDLQSGSTSYLNFVTALNVPHGEPQLPWIDSSMHSIVGYEYGSHLCSYDQQVYDAATSIQEQPGSRFCLWGFPGYSPKMTWDPNNGANYTNPMLAVDGGGGILNGDLSLGQLPTPDNLAGSPSTASGSLPSGTYYAEIVANGVVGTTPPSVEASAVLGGTGQIQWSFNGIGHGNTPFTLYVGTSSGGENTCVSFKPVQGLVVYRWSYVQTAALSSCSAPSNSNTTGVLSLPLGIQAQTSPSNTKCWNTNGGVNAGCGVSGTQTSGDVLGTNGTQPIDLGIVGNNVQRLCGVSTISSSTTGSSVTCAWVTSSSHCQASWFGTLPATAVNLGYTASSGSVAATASASTSGTVSISCSVN